ncbi:hypothetical protein BOM_0667 [Borrelia miyamotoi FR64b]|nr:hypothetical protein BOM_0667 [Borrelia miyamotoi FR64b]
MINLWECARFELNSKISEMTKFLSGDKHFFISFMSIILLLLSKYFYIS